MSTQEAILINRSSDNYRMIWPIACIATTFLLLYINTVQEEILAREIFGEIARLKHLANFTLTNDIWMY